MKTDRLWPIAIPGVLLLALVSGALHHASSARAEERQLDFLRALVDRDYHDLAQRYLDRLESQPNLPRELRDVLPYERATLLLGSARSQRDLIRKQQQLERARLLLEQFIKTSPDHPRAAEAGGEFGKILLERGRVALLQSQLPSGRARKRQLQAQARTRFGEARATLERVLEQYETQLKKLTRQISSASQDDPDVVEARDRVDRHMMQAKLDRAVAQYELAHTYHPGTPPFTEAVQKAAEQFETIHVEYRTQLVGLYGRMWQGRCFQELGEPAKALGFYRELLTGVDEDQRRETLAPLRRLSDNVLYFRLVSLNDLARRDYEVVVHEAESWRDRNGRTLNSEVGWGISLELARAYESLAKQKASGSGEQKQLFKKAARLAGEIGKYNGEHQPLALAMAQRLGSRTRPSNPEGFDDLLDAAHTALNEGFAVQREDGNDSADRAKAQFAEADRLARSALANARSGTAFEEVNEARLVLCYANYQLGRNYEAAVLGEFLARRYPKSGLAVNAAAVALAAFFREYQQPKNPERETDFAHLRDLADWITGQWPEGPEAVRASMTVGAVYQQQGNPSEAALWYLAVAESSQRYAEAQQKAGMAFWDAYLRMARLPQGQRPDRETLQDFQRRAQQHLKRGLDRAGDLETGDMTYTIAASKLSMAQIYLEGNRYREALLIVGPLAEWAREVGSSDRLVNENFVREAYKAALRAYVGVRDLDAAERTMARIESLETAGDTGLTLVYRRLGQELENEINRRRELGDREGLDQMLDSFEAFLDRVSGREAGQIFETLAWTGDAYFRLGQGLDAENPDAADRARAGALYAKASDVFRRILDRQERDPNGTSSRSSSAIRLRLARSLRRQGDFADALSLVSEVLRTNARAVDAQREAAYIYQDWAESEGGHWDEALVGGVPVERNGRTSHLVWGWGTLGRLLQPSATPGSPYYALWHEARYNQAYCRYKKALAETDRPTRTRLLQLADRDVRFTTRLSDDHGGPAWKEKFERLRRDISQALAR